MAAARHRAEPKHRVRRRLRAIAAPAALVSGIAGVVATAAMTTGAGEAPASQPLDVGTRVGAVAQVDLEHLTEGRDRAVSRSASRLAVETPAVLRPRPTDRKFATAPLNVWTQPREQGERVNRVAFGTRLGVTGQTVGSWAEVLMPAEKGEPRVRWVNADLLADRKPEPEPEPEPEPDEDVSSTDGSTDDGSTDDGSTTTGLSSAPCADGSSIESGITSSAVRVYRAVCAAFPDLSSYGGYDPHGEHIDGRAIDFMVTDSSLGQAVADYLLAHAGELQLRDIIWSQHIWTPDQASAGWRYMEDRGSPTANHYDHVHVAVY
ncbi:MAG: Group B streptococcal surface immunogenic protein [uncultured Nocardioidaceae bacterium]|uniref:Group B streptococcal surface immunogenic protein n=1 Tax=uncultured Nocardioidaceae bacterium TaxID=253824 RepID=A0A6J4LP48_9ACTN|nr:MAG: Group B streptococcal surface immunogenic protein [uncultured Nocardioidaceae bacterium]